MYFIKARAVCGKTCYQRTFMVKINGSGRNETAIYGGFAESLIERGWTLPSKFKLPINFSKITVSLITPNSSHAARIKSEEDYNCWWSNILSYNIVTTMNRLCRDIEVDQQRKTSHLQEN